MKNRLSALVVAVACLTVASGAFATTSSINPAVPAQNSPLSSAVLRSNFQAAYNDITTILGELVGAAISALTGDITCSGSGSVACTLANTNTARSDIGLGTASTPLFNGLQLSKNVTALPSAQTGSVLQFGNVDASVSRAEVDGFGASSHFSAVRRDGTNASPTTLQSADEIGSFNAWGYNGTAIIGPQAAVRAFAAQNWSVGANGTYLDFAVTPIGSTTLTEAMVIGNDGGVTVGSPTGGDKGAGTINATGFYVNGTAVGTGGSGSGTVSSGTAPAVAVYPSNGNAVSASTELFATSTSVGIGTSAPGYPVDIQASSMLSPQLSVSSANIYSASIRIANTTTGGQAYQVVSTGSSNSAGFFALYEEGTAKSVLAANGSTGVISTVSGGDFAFSSSSTLAYPTVDTGISRGAADVVDIGNGNAGDTSGKIQAAGYISVGTKYTATATTDTIGTLVGGATAGSFVSSTSGTVAVTLTMGNSLTAPNGWDCTIHDLTTPADTASWSTVAGGTTTTAKVSGMTVSGDTESFHCVGY